MSKVVTKRYMSQLELGDRKEELGLESLRYEDLPDNLTIQELKKYLRVGTNKAYEIAKEIPHFQCGNRRIFPKEKVREWMLNNSQNAANRRVLGRLKAVR